MAERPLTLTERRPAAARPDTDAGRHGGGPVAPREAKKRPDPRPMRFAIGISGIAAAAAMATAIIRPVGGNPASTVQVVQAEPAASDAPSVVQVEHVTRYVQLLPGQTAPPGATVIAGAVPSPRTIIVTVPAAKTPAPPRAPRVVVVTRQSGGK